MSRRSLFAFRRSLFAFVAVCSLAIACSRPGSGGRDPRYPKRKPGCPIAVYNGLPPGPWDDLGVVEVGCYLDEADSICLSRLKAEACYRGGDILYNVPRKPLRPLERAKIFRAQVAHSLERKTAAEDAPAPADAGTQ